MNNFGPNGPWFPVLASLTAGRGRVPDTHRGTPRRGAGPDRAGGCGGAGKRRDAVLLAHQEDNARARMLYDQVARFNGFIRYQYPLL